MLTEDKWKHFIVAAVPGELGQPVAIAVATQQIALGHRRATERLDIAYLQQMPAGTDPQAAADRLTSMLASLDQTEQGAGGVALVLDVSRLGKLSELVIKAGRVPRMVEITNGAREGSIGGMQALPRRDLAAELLVAFKAGKVKVLPELELAQRFTQALTAFQTRPAGSADPFEATRQEADDALVLAVGLCVWIAGREVPGLRGVPLDPRRGGLGDYDPHERWRD